MPDVWIWLTVTLLFAVIATIYIARKPSSQRKHWSIIAIATFLLVIFIQILEPLPLNTLYVLILASTPLLATGFLVLNSLGKRIRAAIQVQDGAQESALITSFLLASSVVLLPVGLIYILIQRSPNIQRMVNLAGLIFFVVILFIAGFKEAIISLREPTGWRSFRFVLALVLISFATLLAYLVAHTVLHVL